MGHRIRETYHRTREEAQDAQLRAATSGIPGYSEVYACGVQPCLLRNLETGETYPGFKSITEEFYG